MTVATVAVLFLSTAANNWNFVAEWGRLDLLEVRVPSDSMLSRVCVEKGGDVLSLGLLNGYNLATKQGYDRACAEIFDKRPRHTWISAPCTDFCSWQSLNQFSRYPVKRQNYERTYKL